MTRMLQDLFHVAAFVAIVAIIVLLVKEHDEAHQWRAFDTPAGEVSCYGPHAYIDRYDLADDCVEVNR